MRRFSHLYALLDITCHTHRHTHLSRLAIDYAWRRVSERESERDGI
jgi:hypothetical protein